MVQVRGIGGIFFKSKNPEALRAWYAKHLGIHSEGCGTTLPSADGGAVWCVFPTNTTYFDPSGTPLMLNYVVDDLAAALEELKAAGVQVDEKIEDCENGRFGWIMDPDGNRVELWEQIPAFRTESA